MRNWYHSIIINSFLILNLMGLSVSARAIEFYPMDLSPWFNNDGIAGQTSPEEGNYDGTRENPLGTYNLAKELLPDSISIYTTHKIPFLFPDKSDGKMNNILCQGQTLMTPGGAYEGLYILGASLHGNNRESILLVYADMSEETTQLALSSDRGKPQFGEYQGIKMPYRLTRTGSMDSIQTYLWLQTISLDTGKELLEIHLPDNENIHLFSLTLARNGKVDFTSLMKDEADESSSGPLGISVQGSRLGNLFAPGDLIGLKIRVAHIPPEIKKLKLNWFLSNNSKTMIAKESVLLTRWTKEGFEYPVPLSPPKAGWYQFTVRLQDPETNKIHSLYQGGLVISPLAASSSELMAGIGTELDLSQLKGEDIQNIGMLSRAAGIRWIRQPFFWSSLQSSPGNWDWSEADKIVESARMQRLYLVGILEGRPGWSTLSTQDGLNDFAQYAYQVINRYGADIKYWELGANLQAGSPQEFLQLLKAVANAARDAHPEARLIIHQKSSFWLESVLSGGGLDSIDGVMVDVPADKTVPFSFKNELLQLREQLLSFSSPDKNNKKEIWILQEGWKTGTDIAQKEVSETQQASNMVKSVLESYLTGYSDRYFWSGYEDTRPSAQSLRNTSGLLYQDLTPKPAWLGLMTLTHQLMGFSFQSAFQYGDSCQFYLFAKNTQKILVGWSDSDAEVLRLKTRASIITQTDMMSNSIIIPPSDNEMFTLTLSKNPLYISGEFDSLLEMTGLIRMKFPQASLASGQKTDFSIKVKNLLSGEFIGDIALQISDTLEQNLFMDEPEPVKPIDIQPGEEKEVKFNLGVSEKANTGFTPLEIRIDPHNGGGFRLQTELKIFNK